MAHYDQDYQAAKAALDGDRAEECIATCELILTDTELPRYYHIKTLILLASATKDWRKKENLRLRAEHTWNESRGLHPKGQNPTTDNVLSDLRTLLDKLKSSQANTAPPDYEDLLSAALAETEIEDLADIADGELEDLADEEYARLQSADDEPVVEVRKSVVGGDEREEEKEQVKQSKIAFAPASSLEASKEVLGARDGQTAGTRMAHRTRGVGRNSA